MKFFDLEFGNYLSFQNVNFRVVNNPDYKKCFILKEFTNGNPIFSTLNNDPTDPCYISCATNNPSYQPPADK